MKKNLIALAVAGAFVAPVAMADTANVAVYGVAHVSVDQTKNGSGYANNNNTGAASTGTTANKISSNQSRIGFKGAEDLGGGLSAVWQIEQNINMDRGATATGTADTLATRNTFVGLKGDSWGTVLAGRHDTPYKIATRGYDVFADTLADNRNIMGMTGIGGAAGTANGGGTGSSHDARINDVVAYISPAINNFTVSAAYVAAAENQSALSKASAYSLAAQYNAGPISASAAYQKANGGGNNSIGGITALVDGAAAKAWKVGGSYAMDAFKVNAVYERTSGNGTGGATPTSNDLEQKNYYIAGTYAVNANDTVKLSYSKAGDVGNGSGGTVASSSAKQYAVGVDHALSKRTGVYLLYTKLDNGAGAKYGIGTGVAGGAVAASSFDADPSAFSIGLKHSF